MVDTNVILRCLLHDNAEQAKLADEVIKNGAWTLPEVLAEVEHVLRTFYGIDKPNIAKQLLIVLNFVEVERKPIMIRAVEIFAETKL